MEFTATVQGEKFRFSLLANNSFLISGHNAEYILYKKNGWQCADEIKSYLLVKLEEVIEEHLQEVYS